MIHKVKVDRTGRNVKSRTQGFRRNGQGWTCPTDSRWRLQVNRKTLGCEALPMKFQRRGGMEGWSRTDAKDVDEQRGRGRWLNT